MDAATPFHCARKGGGCMQMTSVIGERETKVTQALQTMGMMRSAYWLSWLTWEILLAFVIVLIAIAFGAACQINFFLKNAFGNVFFTLFTFQLAMVGFAYFVASFIRKTSTAITLGFAIFLIGFVFQVCPTFLVPVMPEARAMYWASVRVFDGRQPHAPPTVPRSGRCLWNDVTFLLLAAIGYSSL
jgi:hypothetical protein